ncbi:MAG: AMP-binding protein, partial [Blastocatellia bacterium]
MDGETAELRWTHGELDRRARAIGSALRELARPGQPALLLYPPGLDFIAALFGCFYAGVIAAPAYPFDPVRPARTLSRLLAIHRDLSPAVILSTSEMLSLADSRVALPQLQSARLLATDSIQQSTGYDQSHDYDPSDVVFIQYTSGSTGSPRGVMLTNANLLHNAALVYSAVEHAPGDSYVSWLPTFHDMGFMAGVLQPLFAGVPVVLMPPASFLQQPIRWLRAISRYRATTSGAPNFAYELCVRKIKEADREELDLGCWTTAFNGAEPIRSETIERFTEAFSRVGFRREVFYPCYGLAEATLMVSGGQKASAPAYAVVSASALERNRVNGPSSPAEATRIFVGCGRALSGQEVIVVDPDTETASDANAVGEIWVSGPSVARGYWNRIEESAQTFEARLRDTGRGPFLRTGDLGFIQEGQLFIAGRLKDLIIVRGLNHHPQDIELSVERSHPGLRPGCSAAFSIDAGGEERLAVVSEVDSASTFDSTTQEDILGAIREAVAREHEIAVHDIALIEAGNLPKTSSGKVQRRACKSALLNASLNILARWRRAETDELAAAYESQVPATGPAVTGWLTWVLAKLGIDAARLDGDEPLIRHGLDSLAAIELASKIQAETGATVSPASLLQGAGMSEIVRRVAEVQRAAGTGGENRPQRFEVLGERAHAASKEFPLSYGQRGLWFLHQLAPQNPAYNITRAVRIIGALDIAAFRQAVQILVDRHDSLLATFHDLNGYPVQRVQEGATTWFDIEDARTLSDGEMNARLAQRASHSFD